MDRRQHWRRIIFEADTPAGKAFDVFLLALIVFSVLLVMLESVPTLALANGDLFFWLEIGVTALFTVEYLARLWTSKDAGAYARSFFGVIDVLAILPVIVSLAVPGAQSLLVVRSVRLLRVFRVFKMAHWLRQANYLIDALKASSAKILVFLLTVVLINVIVGSTMYVIEGAESGFDSMFRGVYWSIVTMSTVGFGDIAPQTGLGQVLAAGLMILGYSVIAVPTGIVSAEMAVGSTARAPRESDCVRCGHGPLGGAMRYCPRCGESRTVASGSS